MSKLNSKLREYADAYYNTGQPLIEDSVYDAIESNVQNKEVRAPARLDQDEIRLDYFIGSLSKIKSQKQIDSFVSKQQSSEFIVEEKLDGISVILVIDDEVNMYRPTKPTVGVEINQCLTYLDIPPKETLLTFPLSNEKLVIRGELCMDREKFEKYHPDDSKSRSTVSGITGKDNPSKRELKNLTLICYDVLSRQDLIPKEQKVLLKSFGFRIPRYKSNVELTEECLGNLYEKWNSEAKTDIDGLVIKVNIPCELEDEEYPSYAVAFKKNLAENITAAVVEYVEWNVSKHGKLKPRVRIEKTLMDGAYFDWATGKNAKYIRDMGIGKNSVVSLVRSGSVIPDILETITRATPDFPPEDHYAWNETGVDLIADPEIYFDDCRKQIIVNFTKKLNIKYIGEGVVKRLYDNGLIQNIIDLLTIDPGDITRLDGFGTKSAQRMIDNINLAMWKIKNNDGEFTPEGISLLMAGSVCFGSGFGYKKSKILIDAYPNILFEKHNKRQLIEKIIKLPGFQEITANIFIKGYNSFLEFYNEIIEIDFEKPSFMEEEVDNQVYADLQDKKIVFTGGGSSDNTIRRIVVGSGGKIMSSVSSNTDILVVNNPNGKVTTKMSDVDKSNATRKKNGKPPIVILKLDEFKKLYR